MQLFMNIPRVARAFEYMCIAHEGQMYGPLPYFVHPLQVAENLPGNPSEDQIISALLHDVVEDTGETLHDISQMFGDRVAFLVNGVTKVDGLSYDENIRRIVTSGDREMIGVKWADNLVNMRSDKSHMPADRRSRLNEKYAGSFPLLSAALGI